MGATPKDLLRSYCLAVFHTRGHDLADLDDVFDLTTYKFAIDDFSPTDCDLDYFTTLCHFAAELSAQYVKPHHWIIPRVKAWYQTRYVNLAGKSAQPPPPLAYVFDVAALRGAPKYAQCNALHDICALCAEACNE